MECGIDRVIPHAMRTRHNVEIVEIKAGSSGDDVITPGYQDEISIVDGDRFIKFLAGVHALKGKAIGRLNVVVIGLFQIGLIGRILGIMFVWRERGPVASRSDDLDNDQSLGFLIGIQYVLDTALRIALTPSFHTHIVRPNHTRWKM
jgi:hypothetical protein